MPKQPRKTNTTKKTNPSNTPKKPKKAPNLHDVFFKKAFSRKDVAQDYIRKFMPKELSQNIDVDSLVLEPTSYITSELGEYASDLVWSAAYNQKSKVKIAFLFEHKSYAVPYPHIQLMRYILEHLDKQIKAKEALTPILPIIIYHGKDEWKVRPFSDYFENVDEAIKPYIPNFKYHLTDLSRYSDEELLAMNVGKLLNTFLAMAHIRDMAYIRQNFELLFTYTEKYLSQDEDFIQLIFVYLQKNITFSVVEIKEIIQTIHSPIKKIVMTTYDYILQEGLEQGISQGISQGLEQGISQGIEKSLLKTQMTVQEIADFYEVPLFTVITVKDRLVNLGMLSENRK